LAELYDAKAYARIVPAADDLDGWRKTHAAGEEGDFLPLRLLIYH